MSNVLPAVESSDVLRPQGHAIGFVDTDAECDAAVLALEEAGYFPSALLVMRGEEGKAMLARMMEGSLWGESAEYVLKQGNGELSHGHSMLCVQVQTIAEADKVAAIATAQGVRSVYHFGILSDTRLTA